MTFTGSVSWAAIARYTAFGLSVSLAVLGGAFLVGETLMDPGGPYAAPLAIAWVLVTAGLAAYGLGRPEPATRALTVLAVVVAVYIVADLLLRVAPRDLGPVGAAGALAVATGAGFLGLRRPGPAGRLLVLIGVAALGAHGPGTAIAGPLLIAALLFLLAAAAQKRPPGGPAGPPRPDRSAGRARSG